MRNENVPMIVAVVGRNCLPHAGVVGGKLLLTMRNGWCDARHARIGTPGLVPGNDA